MISSMEVELTVVAHDMRLRLATELHLESINKKRGIEETDAYLQRVEKYYDPEAIKKAFKESGRGNLRIDELLGRE